MVKSTNATRRVSASSVTKSSVAVEEAPTVVKGSHLTIYTWSNGRTKLEWDDAALERDVREAIAAYELGQLKPAVKAKAVTRKKKEEAKAPATAMKTAKKPAAKSKNGKSKQTKQSD